METLNCQVCRWLIDALPRLVENWVIIIPFTFHEGTSSFANISLWALVTSA
jgi:hypothetical protein